MGTAKRKEKLSNSIKPQEEKILEKQQLKDLEHLMNMELNTFLVLREEGSIGQLALASQKAKSTLLKYGPEILHLAQEIGGELPISAENYIDSISAILHSAFGWIDEAVIHDYFISSQRLSQQVRF